MECGRYGLCSPDDFNTNCFSVVFITSNYIGNSEIMEGCKEAGIPAFGTLWDFVGIFQPRKISKLKDLISSDVDRWQDGCLVV